MRQLRRPSVAGACVKASERPAPQQQDLAPTTTPAIAEAAARGYQALREHLATLKLPAAAEGSAGGSGRRQA
jgi:hypothetical protein